MLTQEQLKTYLEYNPDTGIFTWKIRAANLIQVGDTAGCKDSYGYIIIRLFHQSYKAHRLAFLYMTGEFPIDQIDHINRIRSDNRWCNLREATNAANKDNSDNPTIWVNYNGVDMPLLQACNLHGIKYDTARHRIYNHNCTPIEAIMIPVCNKVSYAFAEALNQYRKENNK